MSRTLSLGNANMLVLLDDHALVKDFYYPYVGYENHVGGQFIHRIGVYCGGRISWLDDGTWDIRVNTGKETMSGYSIAVNQQLSLTITFHDVIYNEKNIFLRSVTVTNNAPYEQQVKLFFAQQFQIYEMPRGDTAYYDPHHHCIIHYKGRRNFLVNAVQAKNHIPFDDYAVGLFGIEGKAGTHLDAEDGSLSKNPIEHGLVDSVIGLENTLPNGGTMNVYYWIAAAKRLEETLALNQYVIEKSPDHIIRSTEDYWFAWVNKQNFTFYNIDSSMSDLFKKSLLLIRSHIDRNGSIMASGDSDMLKQGRDTYGYMWPRDGAFTAIALCKVGELSAARSFFTFCNEVISKDGYFMHKYRVDRALGSSWHPWVRNGVPILPIQEDETALVLVALWKYYAISKDLDFIEQLYNSLIRSAADFMVRHIEPETGLPLPSYDLWEEKFGISTFTSGAVYYGLRAAARFANVLGKTESELIYNTTAARIREGILRYLYNEQTGLFYKMISLQDGQHHIDDTIDASSIYAIFRFHILPTDDPRVQRAVQKTEEALTSTHIKGIVRYQGDKYYRPYDTAPSNPWFITTLWMIQYKLRKAQTHEDLSAALSDVQWATRYASHTGILSEQIHSLTGEPLSASPLTWSHAEYIVTLMTYMEKIESLGIHQLCPRSL